MIRRIIPILMIITFLFAFPVLAEEVVDENVIDTIQTEETTNETVVIQQFVDVDTELEIENNELLLVIASSVQIIMYILGIFLFVLMAYLFYFITKKLFRYLGLGFL